MNDELKPGQNTGVIVDPSNLDWKASAETGTSFIAGLPDGDWRPYMPSGERQTAVRHNRNYLETDACMTFAALDSLEGLMNLHLANGTMPERHKEFLQQNGYIGDDGKLNFSDRFTAKMSGTTHDGNSFNGVYGSIRHDGLIPEASWPFPVEQIAALPDEDSRWSKYYEAIPDAQIAVGKQFLKYFNINYDLVRYPGSAGHLSTFLAYSPLHVLTGVCPPWNTADTIQACSLPVQHGTAITHIGDTIDILDHYVPFEKHFAIDYPIPWAVRVGIAYLNAIEPGEVPFQYVYQINLRAGDPAGPEVLALQKGLQTAKQASGKPYMTPGASGPFGPLTKAALAAFQADHGIRELIPGTHFGPQSRAALTAALSGGQAVSPPPAGVPADNGIMEEGPTASPNMQQSNKLSLNGTDLWKTLRGALITLAAVALAPVIAYVGAHYLAWSYVVCVPHVPCFNSAFISIPAIGAVLELARRWLAGRGA
jgi:peptidoglycan hydrolase-like protein with peptidoglycan-binding domain